jgi:hypothetical protein
VAVARALAALITAYIPLRLACTALLYCREHESSPENGPTHQPDRWSRAMDWIARHPNLFPAGRFLAGPAALCLVSVMASGAAVLYL